MGCPLWPHTGRSTRECTLRMRNTCSCTLVYERAPIPCHTFTLYIVHCTLYIVHCTLYIVHCTSYVVHCTMFIVHCTSYIVHYLKLHYIAIQHCKKMSLHLVGLHAPPVQRSSAACCLDVVDFDYLCWYGLDLLFITQIIRATDMFW